jgi:hypothetical protein
MKKTRSKKSRDTVPLMYLFFTVYGAGRNAFDAGKSISRAIGMEGVALKIDALLGPESRDFQAHPFQWPSNGFALIKIIQSKRHIKNSYIGNFMYMSFAIAV